MTNAIVQCLNHAAEAWWPFVLHATWTSCLVAAVLLLLVRLQRRWPAKVRHAILLIALVKFALPPTLALPVGLFHWFGPEVVQNAPVVSAENTVGTTSGAGWEDLRWKAWLFVLYSWGTIVAVAAIVRQMFRVRRIVRGATVVTAGPVYERFMRLSKRMGIRRPIRLLASARPVAPMAFGLLRPSVLTPMSVHNRLPADQVETVLAHELAHHRRGDLWLNWFQILLRIVWWFNPVLRVLNRAIRQAGEDCCDDLLLAGRVTTGEGYCQALLRVAKELGRQPIMGGALGFAESIHPLSQRMRRLMDPHLKRSDRIPITAFTPMILLATLVLPGLPSKANPSAPVLATGNSAADVTVAQTDATPPTKTNDSYSATNTTTDYAFTGSMFHPFEAQAAATALQYQTSDQTKKQYTAPNDLALADGEDDVTNADLAAVSRSEEIFAVNEPLMVYPPTLGAETQLVTGSRGNGSRWFLSKPAKPAGTSPSQDQTPLPEQQRLEKQQYADGTNEDPKPMRMPSLPGGDENVPGVEKLQTPKPHPPQLARRLPKRILKADETILAALTSADRLTDTWRLGWTDALDPMASDKPTIYNEYFDEPIALANAPILSDQPMEKNLVTPLIKPETQLYPDMDPLSSLPELSLPPVSTGPCAVPEPLSLCTLGLGLVALLRRRRA